MEQEKILTRDDILETVLKKELVYIPQWNGSVYVQEMTAENRDLMEKWLGDDEVSEKLEGKARAILVVLSVVDENNNRMFGFDDVENLARKHADAVDLICSVAQRLSKYTKGAIENEAKKSPAGQGEDSSSG